MDSTIFPYEASPSKRTYVLLGLNLVGVVACLISLVLLVLWALRMIWSEPEIITGILDFIHNNKFATLRVSDDVDKNYLDVEQIFLAFQMRPPGASSTNSAPDLSGIMRNMLNMSIMTICVCLAIILLFAFFVKIY